MTGISGGEEVTPSNIRIIDMKIARDIDDAFMPVKPSSEFEPETSKVYCWFEWTNATVGESVTVSWKYLKGNIKVLDYSLPIPRTEGSGGAALSMPAGKSFPPGEYDATITFGNKALKNTLFKILPKKAS